MSIDQKIVLSTLVAIVIYGWAKRNTQLGNYVD